jgi:hypothetical protein
MYNPINNRTCKGATLQVPNGELNSATQNKYSIEQPVFNAAGKVIGKIVNNELVKIVDSRIHMLRKPPAWGYDTVIIDQARWANVITLKIVDKVTGITYQVSLVDFQKFCKEFDRGFGKQLFLTLNKWNLIEPDEPTQEVICQVK